MVRILLCWCTLRYSTAPTPKEFTVGRKAEVDIVKLIVLLPQLPPPPSPQLLRRRISAQLALQPCGVFQDDDRQRQCCARDAITSDDGVLFTDSKRSSKQGEVFHLPAAFRITPDETTLQVTARQEFVRLPISRQHQELVVARNKASSLIQADDGRLIFSAEGRYFVFMCYICCFLSAIFLFFQSYQV